jgi:hypothetical protein
VHSWNFGFVAMFDADHSFRKRLRAAVLYLARLCGSNITDYRSGKVVGRALLLPFRGKIHVIGLDAAIVPVFITQRRLTYWKQELGFTAHPEPDFPHEPGA